MEKNTADFRFFEELNDFLPYRKKKVRFPVSFDGSPSIKDIIESQGIPHTEIDLILVNGQSVDFSYKLENRDQVSVYPVFESLDISGLKKFSEKPLQEVKFILDVHLGKLARLLRILGFDTFYRNDLCDSEIVDISVKTGRIILTRDIGILKTGSVTRGYWVRSTNPQNQIREIVRRFDLCSQIHPFTICLICNGRLESVSKEQIADQLESKTLMYFDKFTQCKSCGKIFWEGSHFEKLRNFISQICAEHKKD
jgi:uncharacterized protein